MNLGAFAPVSNKVSWTDTIFAFDATPGDTDLTGSAIEMAVRDQKTQRAVLEASVGSGITIDDGPGGEFSLTFTRAQMLAVEAGTYDVGITVTLADDSDYQLFVGTIRVIDGVVT